MPEPVGVCEACFHASSIKTKHLPDYLATKVLLRYLWSLYRYLSMLFCTRELLNCMGILLQS